MHRWCSSVSGKFQNIQTLVKQNLHIGVWTYYMTHREALAFKEINILLNIVLTIVVTVVNCIKRRSLKSRYLFCILQRHDCIHSALLFYCETRWLSPGKVCNMVMN